MTHILHLSDPHFGKSHHFAQDGASSESRLTLADAVAEALGRHGSPPVSVLVVSGDLLSTDQPSDAAEAQDGLKQLMATLDLDPSNVLCVPGNHDLTWDTKWHKNKLHFYDEVIASARAVGAVGSDPEPPRVVCFEGDGSSRPLAFVLFNSCRIESRQLAGLGEIGVKQLRDAKQHLDDLEVSADSHVIVAVMHHHLLPILPRLEHLYDPDGAASYEAKRPSLVVDAVAALQGFADMGVSVVLHGHQHKAAISMYQDVLHGGSPIRIVAAGSCGTREGGINRHFHAIEIQHERMTVRSFNQSGRDPDRFECLDGGGVELTLREGLGPSSVSPAGETGNGPLPVLGDYCSMHVRGREIDAQTEWLDQEAEGLSEGDSDLFVMMLSVSDCPAAREVIRQAIVELPSHKMWRRRSVPPVSLRGMYDLLGHWDLAVRLRIGNATAPNRVADYLTRRLSDHKLRKDGGQFSHKAHLDVRREANSIRGLLTSRKSPIERRMLGETDDYDRLRCQRSFLWIELGSDQEKVIEGLADALRDEPELGEIIESACLGDQVLLLETFSSCGQSSEIARLNRQIEPVLALWGRQKYTLTCYGYDETPVELRPPGGALPDTEAITAPAGPEKHSAG